ncbi:S1C family serine protease [Amycolatopsis tolypomycina]|uniref:S1C family serine protease n=1 Tax=Amycolatopsis tolypomycina TaxID=208445 RepID=UPI0033A1E2F5
MRKPTIAILAVTGLLFTGGCTSGSGAPPSASASAAPTAAALPDVVSRLEPSVVTIRVDGGLGSGVVLKPDVVVTNRHVVTDQKRVTVAFADGGESPGTVLATDSVTDLAVVRTDRKNLPVPDLRTDLPRPGETVLAIGSPLGFQNSVTAGIISGLHRDIPGSDPRSNALVDLIQTDAPISPGNSGGALLDSAGRLVGINEAYLPPSTGAVAIGFAIPAATMVDTTDQLLTSGTAKHAYLGVSLGTLTPAIRDRLGVHVDQGALVLAVDPNGPADQAGLRPGDVITAFAGRPVTGVDDMLTALRSHDPGGQTTITIVRGGDRRQLGIAIGSRTG